MEKINERFLISPFLVFFVIHSLQVGIGILGFQRIIAKSAGSDSWMSVIIVGMAVHIIIWMIYRILGNSNGDIFYVHKEILGKWFGGLISSIFFLYLISMSITVLRSYIEVIQVWMFQDFNKWVFALYILILIYYIVSGGFRTVVGISFFSIVLTAYIYLLLVFPLQYAHPENLVPLMRASIKDLLIASKDMSLSIIGFEVLLVYYPFIKNAKKSKKWAYLGNMATTLVYLTLSITTFMFYSSEQLDKQIWATLSMFKIIEMPFVERFEYIGIATWLVIILPNICLTIWAASRGIKRVYGVKQRKALIGILLIVFLCTGLLNTRDQINWLNDLMARCGFIFVFIYIPLFFLLSTIVRKWREKN